jgi:hypothetical protein
MIMTGLKDFTEPVGFTCEHARFVELPISRYFKQLCSATP